MKRTWLAAALIVLLTGTSACAPDLFNFPATATPSAVDVPSASPSPSPEPNETATGAAPLTPEPLTLRLWLPPQFDPNGSSPNAVVLKQRLDEYSAAHPAIRLDIRIKGRQDPEGLLEALSLTRSAAPDALPDLVALPRSDLEAAALKGALHPLEGITDELDNPDWYPYARDAGHVQNSIYGLPFAGDALVIVYHPSQFGEPPATWDELFTREKSLALLEEDPNSLFLLDLYLSTGSPLLDRSNHPFLDEAALVNVFTLLQGVRLVPLQSEDAVWRAFTDGRTNMALIWSSRLLSEDPLDDVAIMPLPSLEGTPFTLATTWNWALAGSDPQKDATAIDLGEWLVADEFLADWNEASGYLSPRPNAQVLWDKDSSLGQISQSAKVVPSDDMLAAMGPILQDAFSRIMTGETPEDVASSTVEQLK